MPRDSIPVSDLPRSLARRLSQERLERDAQVAVVQWAALMVKTGVHPELDLLFHVPNAGNQSRATTAKHKAAGLKVGVPDLILPVPRAGACGLAIEMKVQDRRPSDAQQWWLDRLAAVGWITAVCQGSRPAIEVLEDYLAGKYPREAAK